MENIHKQFIEELRKSVQVCAVPTIHPKNKPQREMLLVDFISYCSSAWFWFLLFTQMSLSMYVKEDIRRLVEEGRLDVKLNELDKLERAAKNNSNPAWSVKYHFLQTNFKIIKIKWFTTLMSGFLLNNTNEKPLKNITSLSSSACLSKCKLIQILFHQQLSN